MKPLSDKMVARLREVVELPELEGERYKILRQLAFLFRFRQSRRVYCISSNRMNSSTELMRSKYPFHGM